MVSSVVATCRCRFSSLSWAILANGDEFISCSNRWSSVSVCASRGGVCGVNCVCRTCRACCSFIVSGKSSCSDWLVSGICAVFVRLRYFSTRFSSVWIHSRAPRGSGAEWCFRGSNVVTKVWSSICPGSRLSSSYSPGMCHISARPLGLRYLLRVKSFVWLTKLFGSIVASVARNGGPLMNFVGQSILGLNSRNHG